MKLDAKIYVAGHRGLVGSAIVRKLLGLGYTNLVVKTRQEVNLLDQSAVAKFFAEEKPEYVFMAAAKVGGIHANNVYRADFIYENLVVQNNVIHEAYTAGVQKMVFLGSSCIYPKLAPQPIKEDYLLTGPLEETNQPYAIAKIAGIELCNSYNRQYGTHYMSVMPTNLYGPGDNFDLNNSHMLPALIRKFSEAKASNSPTVSVWGTGTPRRELMHVDDLADAVVYLMQNYDGKEIVNIGTGKDHTILEIANIVKQVVGYAGEIVLDSTKPDGTPQKLLDVARINGLGWTAQITLEEGVQRTVEWYRTNIVKA